MDQLYEYLIYYFNIAPERVEDVATLFTIEQIPKGDRYLTAGKMCTKMSFVKQGILRIHALADGKEITQWISTNGYFVTDLSSFMFSTPATWNIDALADTVLYTISKSNYGKIGTIIPTWEKLQLEFMGHCFVTLESRVFQQLSMSAEERYRSFYKSNKELFNQVPLHYIASMLGMTPETLSRLRQKRIP